MNNKVKKIILGAALLILGLLVAALFLLVQNKKRDFPEPPNSGSQEKYEIVTLPISLRGDFVDPGPIKEECQRDMERYLQSSKFKASGFLGCELFESKVGFSEKECPSGSSPQGCSICKLRCE